MERRTTSRLHSMAAVTSTAMVAFQFSSVCSQMYLSVPGIAALLIMISTLPHRLIATSTMAATSASCVTSARIATADSPISAAAFSTSSMRRAAITTFAPSATSIFDMIGPRPVLAPVTIATLSVNRAIALSPPGYPAASKCDSRIGAAKLVEVIGYDTTPDMRAHAAVVITGFMGFSMGCEIVA